MNTDFILEKLKKDEKFRRLFAKNAVLEEALWALQQGSVTGIVDELYILDDIERMSDLDEILERQLNKANFNLSSTEDFRVPSSAILESLCEDIGRIDGSYEDFSGFWKEADLPNIYVDRNWLTFDMINDIWMEHLHQHQEKIFEDLINGFKESELEKKNLIEQLEQEMEPFQDLARKLIEIEEIEKNWGDKLQEIADESMYFSNFYTDFISKEELILKRLSDGLNEYEQRSLREFYGMVCHELNIN